MAGKAPAYTVIKDTREQDGYTFEAFTGRYTSCKGMIVEKLDTGDYSLEGLEDRLCIERKGRISELAINLGKDKARFMREIERMKEFEFRFLVLEFSFGQSLTSIYTQKELNIRLRTLLLTNYHAYRFLSILMST